MLASTPSKLAVLHGSRNKNPEISPSKPRFGGSMFDFRRFLLETFVSVGRPWIWKCWDFPSLQE